VLGAAIGLERQWRQRTAGLRTNALVALGAALFELLAVLLTGQNGVDPTSHRPQTMQRLRLGATRDGRVVAIDHEGTSTLGAEEANIEPITMVTPVAYAWPNVATHDRQVRLNIPEPGAMRGPGKTEGNFAIESALDELSCTLGIDPIERRLRNYAEVQPQTDGTGMAPAGAFAAQFAEVCIDEDLGLVRIARYVSAVDAGRILNEKLARGQIIGATVMGIGMTLFEDTVFDPATGRIANATFGDYLVPVHADVPDLDVVFVGEPDRSNPAGIKGLGEIGIVGVSAAIANAVYHATGRRIRSLPITIDKLLL
jgi:CO/xanthine dehydrogenase Mo-binding subunit